MQIRESSAPPTLSYVFRFSPSDSAGGSSLDVDLTFTDASQRTSFDVPGDWADQRTLYTAISSLHLISGGTLDSSQIADGRIVVTHPEGEPVHIRYTLKQDWKGPIARATYFRAILQPTWFLIVGHNGLIVPDKPGRLNVSMEWQLPPGAVVGTSWGSDTRQTFDAGAGDLRNAIYAGGALNAFKVRKGNTEVRLVTAPMQRAFADSTLARQAVAIIASERAFWKDASPKSYVVTLLPSVNDIGGTRYTNGMTLFVDPKYALADYTPLIAHEGFHEWLGGMIPQPGGKDEALMKWFAEGFTDYFGDRLMRDAGFMSDSAYADAVNRVIRQYYVSPARDATRAVIAEKYWTDPDVNRISYQRGRLFALRLDTRIRGATGGRKRLDDLLPVVARLVPDSAILSDSIVAVAGDRIVRKLVSEEIDRYIVRGTPVDIPATALGDCFRMDSVSIPVFELGFDLAASKSAKRITGVRAGTRAYQAGLRDGMELKGISLWNGDATKDATFKVMDGGAERSITYRPVRIEPARVPQFVATACAPKRNGGT